MAELRITGATINLPSNSVTNDHINATTTKLDADKLQHLYKPGTGFALAIGGTPATREEIVFVASTAGLIRGLHALLNDTGTSTDIDFDLKVNGVSVLSAVLNFTHADVDKSVKDGTISSAAVAADDIISISMTVTSATGALGPFAWVEIEENAS